jgi:hypothetical protein
MLVAEDDRRVYQARGNPGRQTLLTMGGCVLIMAMLFLALKYKISPMLMAILGWVTIAYVFVIGRSLSRQRDISRVIIDKDGMCLESPNSSRTIAWTEIEQIRKREHTPLVEDDHDAILLLGENGEVLERIRASIDGFGELVQQIAERSTLARGAPTADFAADDAGKMARTKLKLRIVGAICTLFALLFAFVSVLDLYRERRYANQGVTVAAQIIDRHDDPRRPSLRYHFADAHGVQFIQTVVMEKDAWDKEGLMTAKSLPVVYLPSNPRWNRPISGMRNQNMTPFFVSGVLLLGSLSVGSFLGYEIKADGGMKITRWGEPIRD